MPIMIVAPVLFFVGVVFTYIAVLGGDQVPAGLNGSQFNALVQAQPLYSFEVLTMAAIGLAFEMPLVLLRLRRGGHRPQHPHRALALRVRDHRRHRRGDAGSRPGDDRPGDRSVILFRASIVLLKVADRRVARRAAAEGLAPPGIGDPS